MTENTEQYLNQIALARSEIKNLRQQISSLKHEHLKEIKLLKSTLEGLKCASCAKKAASLIQNTQNGIQSLSSVSNLQNEIITYKPIGIIETTFQNKRGVPRQPSVLAKAKGTVVINQRVFNNPEHALCGLQEFSHMWIVFHFHATESNSVPAKVAPPRLSGARSGVFATRSPHRPCPIGLSLVRIHSIEGNKIHFLGVDMVNGTPVLDIKPYIPQYDYPAPTLNDNDNMSTLERPPTEGVSDAVEQVAGLRLDDDVPRSVTPRHVSPEATTPRTRSPFVDEEPSYEEEAELLTPQSPMSGPGPNGTCERGAPDGQERFTPPQSALNMPHDGIRVPPWIANPPSQTYDVRFTEDVNNRLVELIGDRASSFKSSIQCLLSEDPRSHYVRNRYPNHEYSCVLEDLSVSCVFDDQSSVCTIIAVRSAEDMQ